MDSFEKKKKAEVVLEMFEQIEEALLELRLEYMDIARDHDEAQIRIEELEVDNSFLYESMKEMETEHKGEVQA